MNEISTKKEIKEEAIVFAVEKIEEGREDPLGLYIKSMQFIEYYTAMAKAYHDAAMQEFEMHGEKEIVILGKKVSKFEAGVKYNFSKCGHLELDALERINESTAVKIKAYKDQIKYIQDSQTMVNEDGEVFTVTPPTKTSTTKLKLIY